MAVQLETDEIFDEIFSPPRTEDEVVVCYDENQSVTDGIHSSKMFEVIDSSLEFNKPFTSQIAAGIDIITSKETIFTESKNKIVNLGLNIKLSKDFNKYLTENKLYLQMVAKSTNFCNYIILSGVIDADYEGELFVKILILNDETIVIKPNTPIAQLLICKSYKHKCLKKFNKDIKVFDLKRGSKREGGLTKLMKSNR